MDTPRSPTKRLRQLRTLSILDYVQGQRLRVVRGATPGSLLSDVLRPHVADMKTFANKGSPRRLSRVVEAAWDEVFPMVLPPDAPDGLGIVALNSNADTHFSSCLPSFLSEFGVADSAEINR